MAEYVGVGAVAAESSPVSAVSSVGAYARVASLSGVAAVQAADPVRSRFQVGDGSGLVQEQSVKAAGGDQQQDKDGIFSRTGRDRAASGTFGRLLGAFTSFLTSIMGQSASTTPVQSPQLAQNGVAAYDRVQGNQELSSYDSSVIMPNFAPLSSGRVLDLSV